MKHRTGSPRKTYAFRIVESRSRLGLAALITDPRFERVLTIDGKAAYELASGCWSCYFSFNRLPHADTYESDGDEHALIGTRLTRNLIGAVCGYLPDGEYVAMDLTERPRLVEAGGPGDYFSDELPRSWDLRGLVEEEKEYYRSRSLPFGDAQALFEFIVPLTSQRHMHPDVMARYEQHWPNQQSAIVALSTLDIHGPADWEEGHMPELKEHWCLTHFLLDGHHRMLAAARRNRTVQLVSFLSMAFSAARREDLETLQSLLGQPSPMSLGEIRPRPNGV